MTHPRTASRGPARGRKMRTSHRVLAWVLIAATLAICVAVGPRLRGVDAPAPARRIARLARLVTRDAIIGEDPPAHPDENGGTLFGINYLAWYEATPEHLRPLYVTFLIFLLLLLFNSIGITASDFFCPNLATAASYMGLSETTAGVTLLAFGNGSPDVFSTFATVRQGTFGLAVGELIGAASFITSIVVGSIAMVRPFHVPRHPFLRDAAFFTLAVLLLMLVLRDGKLTLRESGGMVTLYVCYVLYVVAHNWYTVRQRRKKEYAAMGWKRDDDERTIGVPVDDEADVPLVPETPLTPTTPATLSSSRHRRPSAISIPDDSDADMPRAGFSLLGAVEFRDVVNSLRKDKTPGSSRGGSRPSSPSPEAEFVHHTNPHHLHHRSSSHGFSAIEPALIRRASGGRRRARSRTASSDDYQPPLSTVAASPSPPPGLGEEDSAEEVLLSPIPPATPAYPATPNRAPRSPGNRPLQLTIPSADTPARSVPVSPVESVPAIAIVDPEGAEFEPIMPLTRTNTVTEMATRAAGHVHSAICEMLHALFPALRGFRHKSLLGMALAVFSTPSIFILTLTLPVVDDGRGDEGGVALPVDNDEPLVDATGLDDDDDGPVRPEIGEELHHLVESGVSASLDHMRRTADGKLSQRGSIAGSVCSTDCSSDDGCDPLSFYPQLAAAQCFFGPLVCTYLVFQDEDYLRWVMLGAGIAGAIAGGITYTYATDGTTQPWRLVRCCAGFICSMVWIACIADEVVAVLQTFGEIFGLSEAIIGLTIFAVGNSLADLVANVTIAQFAPNMAYAACFGGPMLNLLLGVGGAGSYSILSSPTHAPVMINFSPTLWVSGTGLILILLGTAVVVPLNKYLIDRRWAACLLVAYVTLMTVNVIVEIKSERKKRHGE